MKKLIFLFAIVCMLTYCHNEQKKPQGAPAAFIDTEQNASLISGLDPLNFMRLSAGKFLKIPHGKVPITSRQDLNNSFSYIAQNDSQIVIYFHGGLIPIKRAYRDPINMKLDSTLRNAGRFPFYVLYGGGPGNIIWTYFSSKFDRDETQKLSDEDEPYNPMDSLMDRFFTRKSFRYLFIQLKRHFSAEKGAALLSTYQPIRDTSKLDALFEEEFKESRSKDLSANAFVTNSDLQENLVENLYEDPYLQDLAKKDLGDAKTTDLKNLTGVNPIKLLYNVTRVVAGITKRMIRKRNHYIVMTITEEIVLDAKSLLTSGVKTLAQQGWKELKEDVARPFKDGANEYGGTALLDELLRLDSLDKINDRVRKICLIGSSTGAVMICNLLQAAAKKKYAALHFDIIFAVPACTFRLFDKTLDAAEHKIDSFYMFALSDEDEKQAGWPVPYPGTILYFVSGICEFEDNSNHDEPVLGMQRFYEPDFIKLRSLSYEDRQAMQHVYTFMDIKNRTSSKVIWSHEKAIDPVFENTAKKHAGVVRNLSVQNGFHYILTKK